MPLKSMTTPCIHHPNTCTVNILPAIHLTKLVSNYIAVFTVPLGHLQIIPKIFEVHAKDVGYEAVTIVSISLKKILSSSNIHNIVSHQVLKPLHFVLFRYLTPSTSNTFLITPPSHTQRAKNTLCRQNILKLDPFIAKINIQ